jgi:hypothetical protein
MTGFTGFTSSCGIGVACVGVFGLIGFTGFTSPSDIGILLTFCWFDINDCINGVIKSVAASVNRPNTRA